jgi:hypothetical protein
VERRDLRVVLKIDVTARSNELFHDGLMIFCAVMWSSVYPYASW